MSNPTRAATAVEASTIALAASGLPGGAALRRFQREPSAVVGLAILLLFVAVALLASWLAPYPPLKQDLGNALAGPSAEHLLGTDQFGRDLLSRIIWGSRVSLLVGVVAVGIALVVGGALGLVSGMLGGLTDLLAMRLVDILLSFPTLLIALLIVAILKPGLVVVLAAVGLSAVPSFARLVRAEVLALREREFVLAARAIGVPGWRITLRYVLPNLLGTAVVLATALLATAIITEANLSFLGLGVPQDVPSWGSMVSEGKNFLLSNPQVSTLPGLMIMVVVAAVTFLGDFLRDVLDPRFGRDEL